jgi:hypothetical protein
MNPVFSFLVLFSALSWVKACPYDVLPPEFSEIGVGNNCLTNYTWEVAHPGLEITDNNLTISTQNKDAWRNGFTGNITCDECCYRWGVEVSERFKGGVVVGISDSQSPLSGHLAKSDFSFLGVDSKDKQFGASLQCRANQPPEGHSGFKRDLIVVSFCPSEEVLVINSYLVGVLVTSRKWTGAKGKYLAVGLKRDKGFKAPGVAKIVYQKTYCTPAPTCVCDGLEEQRCGSLRMGCCNDEVLSACAQGVNGGNFCHISVPCEEARGCVSDSDCFEGMKCMKSSCCEREICVPPCSICLNNVSEFLLDRHGPTSSGFD